MLGTFAVQQAPLKEALLAKFDKTAELLMIVICERGKAKAAEVSTAFAEMYDRLQEQPKDIEKLTEISEFMVTLMEKSEELQVQIETMTAHFEVLETLQFETPQEDFTARWETFHWPLRRSPMMVPPSDLPVLPRFRGWATPGRPSSRAGIQAPTILTTLMIIRLHYGIPYLGMEFHSENACFSQLFLVVLRYIIVHGDGAFGKLER